MIRKLISLLFFVFISSFGNANIILDSVIYKNLNSCLILYGDSTFCFKYTGVDIFRLQCFGDDTVSYGKYLQYKNRALYLYSHPFIMPFQLNVIALEEKIESHDSITIILSSPFKEQCKEYPKSLKNAYFYLVELFYADTIKEEILSYRKSFFNDTILIPNFSKKLISKISITIYPYKSIGLGQPYYKYLSTNYFPKDYRSNYFSLHIPQFSACYMYYERFYNKEVEIIDKCTIAIDKKTLLSKCKGKKFKNKWKYIIFKCNNPYGTDRWGEVIED
jgi:hypothetical protein